MARNLAEELFGPGGELEKVPAKKAAATKKVAKVTGDVGLLDEEQDAEKAAKREKRKKKLSKAIEKW